MIYSAGIIPFRRNNTGELEFFVGRPGGIDSDKTNYFAFLKGHVEHNETWEETAFREFREESNAPLTDVKESDLIPLGTTQQNNNKVVIAYGLYYPNIVENQCFSNIADNGLWPEIDKYAWMTYDELKEITHPTHLKFYDKITDMLK